MILMMTMMIQATSNAETQINLQARQTQMIQKGKINQGVKKRSNKAMTALTLQSLPPKRHRSSLSRQKNLKINQFFLIKNHYLLHPGTPNNT